MSSRRPRTRKEIEEGFRQRELEREAAIFNLTVEQYLSPAKVEGE